MLLQVKQGDLMDAGREYVICHCISADCAMGAGVVVPIRKKYAGVRDACAAYVESRAQKHSPVVGTAFRYACEAGVVYNLFSKRDAGRRAGDGMTHAQYHAQLRGCLADMRAQMERNGEKRLAMPKIACGIDRCRWEDVEAVIRDVFDGADVEILVYVLCQSELENNEIAFK